VISNLDTYLLTAEIRRKVNISRIIVKQQKKPNKKKKRHLKLACKSFKELLSKLNSQLEIK